MAELLTPQQEKAAVMLAVGGTSNKEIAAACGVSDRSLRTWKTSLVFQARLGKERARFADELRDRLFNLPIARQYDRIEMLNDLAERMYATIKARAKDDDVADVAGGKQGIIVHNVKGIGSGTAFERVDTYEADTALTAEFRATLMQAARELGQIVDKKDVTSGGETIKAYIGFDTEAL